MKIKKYLSIIMLLMCLSVPIATQAIDLGTEAVHKAGMTAEFERAGETTLARTVGSVIRIFLSLIGIIFTALMLYGGYLWMTAGGNEQQIDKAKDTIKAAIIGLIIAIAAYAIADYVVPAVIRSTQGSPLETP